MATTSGSVFFQASILFSITNAKCWPILTHFGLFGLFFLANSCTFWCNITGLNGAVANQYWQNWGLKKPTSAIFCIWCFLHRVIDPWVARIQKCKTQTHKGCLLSRNGHTGVMILCPLQTIWLPLCLTPTPIFSKNWRKKCKSTEKVSKVMQSVGVVSKCFYTHGWQL